MEASDFSKLMLSPWAPTSLEKPPISGGNHRTAGKLGPQIKRPPGREGRDGPHVCPTWMAPVGSWRIVQDDDAGQVTVHDRKILDVTAQFQRAVLGKQTEDSPGITHSNNQHHCKHEVDPYTPGPWVEQGQERKHR